MSRAAAVSSRGVYLRHTPTGLRMARREFQLNEEYIRLCDLLKLSGIAASGAQGKQLVAAGEVRVDGQPESRKTAKIRAGQTVTCQSIDVLVLAKV